jgi:hypothetical protein
MDETNEALQFLISNLFYAIEHSAIRAHSYKEVIAAHSPELEAKVREVESILRSSSTLHRQYTQLRKRAIQAVQDQNLQELSSLAGEVSAISRLNR